MSGCEVVVLPKGKLARLGTMSATLGWGRHSCSSGRGCGTGKRWVSSVDAVFPHADTVIKLRLGPGRGARVGTAIRATVGCRGGIAVSDKSCTIGR